MMRKWRKMLAISMMGVMMTGMLAGCGGNNTEDVADATSEEAVSEDTEAAEDTTEAEDIAEAEPYGTGNLLKNGECDGDVSFSMYVTSGGKQDLNNVDGEMVVDIESIGTQEHSVQIYQDGFQLRQGGVYEFSFDARSTVDREVAWRFQINGGDYHAYADDYFELTSEMQHYTYEFTMEEDTDPAPRLCFNLGYTLKMQDEGADPNSIGPHSIIFDNLSLTVSDGSNMIQDAEPVEINPVKLDQIGYRPDDQKLAIFSDLAKDDTTFTVVDTKSGETVFEGGMTEPDYSMAANEMDTIGDFSEVKDEGTYKIVTSAGVESYEFTIADNVYDDVYKSIVQMLYLQRCGTELDSGIAGDFAHAACHTDMATIYGTSNKIDVSGGWHDAGDYGRYVVPGAKAAADLLLSYDRLNADKIQDTDNLGIPESGNGVSDLLDEAIYELDWMLKMQDSSGGVYHKVTCANFPDTVLAVDETAELIVCPISNTATGDFAAVMALAGRILDRDGEGEYKDRAATYLEASKKAWEYLTANVGNKGFKNPDDIVTGEYPDGNCIDELFWASAELYKVTGDSKYKDAMTENVDKTNATSGLGWTNVGLFGCYSALTNETLKKEDSSLYSTIETYFNKSVDEAVRNISKNEYKINKLVDFEWGSNMSIANTGIMFMMANDINSNSEYVDYAKQHMHYLFGANATGYCFVTGYGTMTPEHPHHRPSEVLEKAMPGMLVGGPDSAMEDPYAKAVFLNVPAARRYADNAQSYSTNEVTIYWNSPLIYLMTAVLE